MSQATLWFERRFEFSFPVELYPNLCARLRGTPARLEEVLAGRSHQSPDPESSRKSGRLRNTPVTCLTWNRSG